MIEKLNEELREIQNFLEVTVGNDPSELYERIADLQVYLARSGEISALTKELLRARKSLEIANIIMQIATENRLSAGIQNALLESSCRDEAKLADWADRVNRSCVHQLDATRSLLSYENEAMRLNNTGY